MHRLYLDWNVFSYLRLRKETDEPFITLFNILTRHKDKVLMPYSPAHLNDLKRSYKKSETGKTETLKDLEFLGELSRNYCISEGYKDEQAQPYIVEPKTHFFELLENDDLLSIDNLFGISNEFGDAKLESLWNQMVGLMKLIPHGIDLNGFEQLPAKYQGFSNLLNKSRDEGSMYALLEDSLQILGSFDHNPKWYKEIRTSVVEDLKVDTDPRNWGDAFSYIEKTIGRHGFNKTFPEFVKESLETMHKDKELTKWDYFIHYYLLLDMFGFHRDKEIPNLIDDASHAYYGAHCDFFITNDERTYHKTKAIYERLKIGTTVCKPDEFIGFFYKKSLLVEQQEAKVHTEVADCLKSGVLLINSFDDDLNPVSIYKPDYPILSFFDRLQVTQGKNSTAIYLFKKQENYSNFLFYAEMEAVVNKLVSSLGVDSNGMGKFDLEREKETDWRGRVWELDKSEIRLTFQNKPIGLCLEFRFWNEPDYS